MEPLVQDVQFKAWRNLSEFRGSTTKELWAWIGSIAKNTSVDHIKYSRAQKRGSRALARLPEDSRDCVALTYDTATPGARAARIEQLEMCETALATLTEEERLVVERYLLDEIPFERVASEIHKSKGATRQIYYRAVNKLREAVAKRTDEPSRS